MERGLNAELTEHLGYEKHATEGRGPGNSGNGSNAKTVSTIGGDVDLAMIASRHPASADFGLMGVATTLIGLLPTYATIGVWAPAGLGDPHVFDDRPSQYVAHYLLGARLHDPNWTVLRTAIGNVFRNVAIAHPTVRRFHFVCHRRDLGRILRTHHGPVSCRYHRLDWFSWRVPGRHGHNFWRSGPDYQGAT